MGKRARLRSCALALAGLGSLSLSLAGCDTWVGGVCLAERFVEPACEAHQGQGYLVETWLEDQRVPLDPDGAQRPTPVDPSALLAQWPAREGAWTELRVVEGARFVFARNAGHLARLDASGGTQLLGELGRGWSDFDAAPGADGETLFAAIDAFEGRLWTGRLSLGGRLETLAEVRDEALRDRERVRLVPDTPLASDTDSGVVAGKGHHLEIWSPFESGGLALPLAGDPSRAELLPVTAGRVEQRCRRMGAAVWCAELNALGDRFADPSLELGERRALVQTRVWRRDAAGERVIEAFTSTAWISRLHRWSHLAMSSTGRGRLELLWYDTREGLGRQVELDLESETRLRERSYQFEAGWHGVELARDPSALGRGKPSAIRVLGLNPEGQRMLDPAFLIGVAERLDPQLIARSSGHQWWVQQAGATVYREHRGSARMREPTLAGVEMQARTRMNVASLSKLITAVSVLREVEAGGVDLDAALGGELGGEEVARELDGLTLRELLVHRSAWVKDDCARDLEGDSSCRALLERGRDAQQCSSVEGHRCCERRYQNANYQLLRRWLERRWKARGRAAFEAESRARWMDAIGLEAATCAHDPEDPLRYYDTSNPRSFVDHQPSGSGGCDSSGWRLNAPEVVRLLRALRYRWLLGDELSDELEGCGETGWMSWDLPWPGRRVRLKDGFLATEEFRVSHVAARLPGNVDAVLLIPSSGAVLAETALREAWYPEVTSP